MQLTPTSPIPSLSDDMQVRRWVTVFVSIVLLPVAAVTLLLSYAYISDSLKRHQGNYVGYTGDRLARELVDGGLPAAECGKLSNLTFALFAPSTGEHVSLCYYTYAVLTHGPS